HFWFSYDLLNTFPRHVYTSCLYIYIYIYILYIYLKQLTQVSDVAHGPLVCFSCEVFKNGVTAVLRAALALQILRKSTKGYEAKIG
ncbi:MAG: hypothetical protein N0E48_22255, partial [Candidatus Thiodiazotropha endolucinida]|nr:hypothetical protein [Candidatus Thiodiazotropha taylori]MCW4346058.1 hypothetical protein [Candidatus Thiodiazotropha endolucinida]